MNLKYALCSSLGLAFIWLFASCQAGTEPTVATSPMESVTGTEMPQSLVESTLSSMRPTATATVNIEMTLNPVPDPTTSPPVVLETATPSPTWVTPTVVVTLTPLPTLEGEELESAVAELLANPMNCDVPCWWEAVPNETTAVEVLQFLSLYQFTFHELYDNQILDFIEVWVGFDENENQFDFRVMYSFENSVLKGMFIEQSPTLDEILGKYGQPDEVWLSTESSIRDGNLAVRLNMLYLQEGMAVGYVVNGTLQNDVVIGCFPGEEMGLLQLNTPTGSANYQDFRGIFEVDRLYLPLEEATGMTMDDFMQQFSDPTQPQCIETLTELWE